jgi:hypothetical protein
MLPSGVVWRAAARPRRLTRGLGIVVSRDGGSCLKIASVFYVFAADPSLAEMAQIPVEARSTARRRAGVSPVCRWRNVVMYCTDLKPVRAAIALRGRSVSTMS